MLLEALGAVRDLGRVQEIAVVLIRYGFGDVVQRIGMAGVLERAGRVLHWHPVGEELLTLSPPQRVRRALEDMGPTFVKLGQILATRVDLFGPEWIAEFSLLQNAVPAAPFARIAAQMEEDLGCPPHEVFRNLSETPLAAASLGQAYLAELADGTRVVLKVRRPDIAPTIEADLRLLNRLAEAIENEMPDWRRYRPRDVVRQFGISLRRELDFAAECRSAERIARNFEAFEDIVVPRVHWDYVSERLNVQDFVAGVPGSAMERLDAAGLDRVELARRGAAAILKMVLEDGFFHADPHPGNVFFLPENRIALIDFGMVGRLSVERRQQIARLLNGLATQQVEAVSDVLLDWSGNADIDESQLITEIDAFVDNYRGVPLKHLGFGRMLTDMIAVMRNNGLTLPPDLALMLKTFVTLEGMARELDPDFDMAAVAAPYLRRALAEQYSPRVLARRGWHVLSSAVDLISSLPRDLRQILRLARRGKLHVEVEVTSLKPFGDQLDRAVSRLTVGLVTSALIIGSAIVMNIKGPVSFSSLSGFGVLGFIGAAIGGVWVLVSILRGGRR